MTLEQIRNYVAIDAGLATSGQPSEAELAELAAGGFEVVVNLGLLDPAYCLPDEAATVTGLGMSYHHLPVDFQDPTLADFERFRAVMREARGRRVLVHCAMNYRVSCFVALLGQAERGWSRAQADEHIRRLWEPNPLWAAFLEQARAAIAP